MLTSGHSTLGFSHKCNTQTAHLAEWINNTVVDKRCEGVFLWLNEKQTRGWIFVNTSTCCVTLNIYIVGLLLILDVFVWCLMTFLLWIKYFPTSQLQFYLSTLFPERINIYDTVRNVHTHTRPCWTHINVCVWLLVVSSLTTPGKQLLTENSPTAVTTVVVQRNQTWLWVIVNWFSETAEKLSSLI